MISGRVAAVVLVLVGTGWPAAAQTDLAAIRGLYAAAEYEKALTAIAQLQEQDQDQPGSADFDLLRVLCLTALGRSNEAESGIEAIIAADPLYEPGADAAPRIRSAFSRVRRRLAPAAAGALYTEGKTAFDRKSFDRAVPKLERALAIINHEDLVDDAALGDLRTLVTGFLDLSRAVLPNAQPSSPARATPAAVQSTARAAARVTAMTEPVAIRQEMPKWNISVAGTLYEAEFKGIVEVEIDESGSVTAATIIESVHPGYDRLLLTAARDWKYEPARQSGKPVKTRKRVEVLLRPR
jgi:TonB family protein